MKRWNASLTHQRLCWRGATQHRRWKGRLRVGNILEVWHLFSFILFHFYSSSILSLMAVQGYMKASSSRAMHCFPPVLLPSASFSRLASFYALQRLFLLDYTLFICTVVALNPANLCLCPCSPLQDRDGALPRKRDTNITEWSFLQMEWFETKGFCIYWETERGSEYVQVSVWIICWTQRKWCWL